MRNHRCAAHREINLTAFGAEGHGGWEKVQDVLTALPAEAWGWRRSSCITVGLRRLGCIRVGGGGVQGAVTWGGRSCGCISVEVTACISVGGVVVGVY